MPRNICVFCSSSDVVGSAYFAAADELGSALARRGDVLVYGGAKVGLMGTLARAVHREGGRVVGVIPGFMATRGLAYAPADELIIARNLRERKASMENRADAFIALPGGFGTLEEMLEIITLKQLQQHGKPVLFLNTAGFYDPLAALFEHMRERGFVRACPERLYYFASDAADAFRYLDAYRPTSPESKWQEVAQP